MDFVRKFKASVRNGRLTLDEPVTDLSDGTEVELVAVVNFDECDVTDEEAEELRRSWEGGGSIPLKDLLDRLGK